MGNKKTLNHVMKQIIQKYTSLKAPKRFFVREEADKKPYEKVISQLRNRFEIGDITDTNDDVSFVFSLKSKREKNKEWTLQLSMVGPYAVLYTCDFNFKNYRVLTIEEGSLDKDEKFILDTLKDYKLQVLDKEILSTPIDMKMYIAEPGEVTFYHALFSDGYGTPWQTEIKK